MSKDIDFDTVVNERIKLQNVLLTDLAATLKTIATLSNGLFTSVAATTKYVTFTEYLAEDNESRLAVVVGSNGESGVAGDIVINVRALTRGGAFWGDFVNKEGRVDGHRSLTVVELAPLLRLAKGLATKLATGWPSDKIIVTKV